MQTSYLRAATGKGGPKAKASKFRTFSSPGSHATQRCRLAARGNRPAARGREKKQTGQAKKRKKKTKNNSPPLRLHAEMPLVNNVGRMATATKPCHKGRPLQTTSMRRASLIGMSTFMSATRTLRATQTPAWGQERALPTARPPNDVRRNARSSGVRDPLLPDCQPQRLQPCQEPRARAGQRMISEEKPRTHEVWEAAVDSKALSCSVRIRPSAHDDMNLGGRWVCPKPPSLPPHGFENGLYALQMSWSTDRDS